MCTIAITGMHDKQEQIVQVRDGKKSVLHPLPHANNHSADFIYLISSLSCQRVLIFRLVGCPASTWARID